MKRKRMKVPWKLSVVQNSDTVLKKHCIKTFLLLLYVFPPNKPSLTFKPSVSVILCDFTARSTSWWSSDINSLEGSKLFSLSILNVFHQIISEPTHVQRNSSSCINLVFTDQPNLVINNRVHASLHSSCHRQIIHCTFNLNDNIKIKSAMYNLMVTT